MVGRESRPSSPSGGADRRGVLERARTRVPRGGDARSRCGAARRDPRAGGAGRRGAHELAETLFGLTPADAGEIRLREPRCASSRRPAIALDIGYVPEDRRRHGVILEMPVAANTSLASLGGCPGTG